MSVDRNTSQTSAGPIRRGGWPEQAGLETTATVNGSARRPRELPAVSAADRPATELAHTTAESDLLLHALAFDLAHPPGLGCIGRHQGGYG